MKLNATFVASPATRPFWCDFAKIKISVAIYLVVKLNDTFVSFPDTRPFWFSFACSRICVPFGTSFAPRPHCTDFAFSITCGTTASINL